MADEEKLPYCEMVEEEKLRYARQMSEREEKGYFLLDDQTKSTDPANCKRFKGYDYGPKKIKVPSNDL
jgi:transposase